MFDESLKEVLKKYPEALSDRTRFLGLLRDFFPNDRLHTNLLMMAFDIGIYTDIERVNELNNILFGRFTKILISDYGISEENAAWSVKTWFTSYGELLGKQNTCEMFEETTPTIENEPKRMRQPQAKKQPVEFSKQKIDLSSYKDGQKLPKSILRRESAIEKKFGFTDMKFTISKDDWFGESDALKIVGELYGNKLTCDYVVLVFTVYNENGEIIGADFGEKISGDDFEGYCTVSRMVDVPKDEYISEIRFRPILDPCFAD